MVFILLILMAKTLAAARPLDHDHLKPQVGDISVMKAARINSKGPIPPSAPSACTDEEHMYRPGSPRGFGYCPPNHA